MIKGLRTWIEIDKQALKENYRVWRRLAGASQLMAVVKSNAYGHGLADFSRYIQKLGVDWFGVDSITEALTLRQHGIQKPILVLGFTLPENFRLASRRDISLTISSLPVLKLLIKSAPSFSRPIKIHLKMDTGMHRQGFLEPETPLLLTALASRSKNLIIEGVYTHFAAAKHPAFPQTTLNQINQFQAVTEQFEKAGLKPLKHAAATSGVLLFPQARYDLARVGLGLYGLWPSSEIKAALGSSLNLKPALCWKTLVSEIKTLPKGSKVGYDLTETLNRVSTIGICPVGYWHGLTRNLSSIGAVLVRDQRAKILGRVSMDMIIIDLSDISGVKLGDIATIIGQDKETRIMVDELANLAEVNNYEFITRLNPLMKRIYV